MCEESKQSYLQVPALILLRDARWLGIVDPINLFPRKVALSQGVCRSDRKEILGLWETSCTVTVVSQHLLVPM